MKKRPCFKVAAIESLETRELLSTTAFRPIQLRSSQVASLRTTAQPVTVNPSVLGSRQAIHVQGGPSATFNAQGRNQVPQGISSQGRSAYSALLQASIARRAQRMSPTVAATPAVSSTPTKLAPSLPFTPTPTGNSGTVTPAFSMNQGINARTSRFSSTSSPIVVQKAGSNSINIQKISGSVAVASNSATSSTLASTSTITASTVASYKLAVDNFASSYSSGLDKTRDSTALSALNASLALLGSNTWPINPSITTTAVSGFQSSVNAFAQTFTGGANPTADAAAWSALSTALGLFSTSSSSTTVATASTTSTSTNAATSTTDQSVPEASTTVDAIIPVINGLMSGIVSAGTISSDSLAAFRNAIDNFATSFTSGTNTTADKVATINFVTSLNSIAMTQWNKVTVSPTSTSSVSTTTPATATVSAVVTTPVAAAATPTAVSTPTPVTTTATTTATDKTNSKSGVLFTAIRAPGV